MQQHAQLGLLLCMETMALLGFSDRGVCSRHDYMTGGVQQEHRKLSDAIIICVSDLQPLRLPEVSVMICKEYTMALSDESSEDLQNTH